MVQWSPKRNMCGQGDRNYDRQHGGPSGRSDVKLRNVRGTFWDGFKT